MPETRKDLITRLKKDILLWEGFKPSPGSSELMGLGPVEQSFPNGIFPKGVLHEFINTVPEDAAACNGFLGGLLASLMQDGGVCVWVSTRRRLFPASLQAFGVEPDRIVFIDVNREKDVLWILEEALKCDGVAAVVGELNEISFMQSRRLQLAMEQSRVTGFILRSDLKKLNTTACVARWKITPIPSETEDEMPGVGYPRWRVELLKVRNGIPGVWKIEWLEDHFAPVVADESIVDFTHDIAKVG